MINKNIMLKKRIIIQNQNQISNMIFVTIQHKCISKIYDCKNRTKIQRDFDFAFFERVNLCCWMDSWKETSKVWIIWKHVSFTPCLWWYASKILILDASNNIEIKIIHTPFYWYMFPNNSHLWFFFSWIHSTT